MRSPSRPARRVRSYLTASVSNGPMNDVGQFDFATKLLRTAGWFEGRDVAEKVVEWRARLSLDGFEPFVAAERGLREFGGIRIEQRGPGINLARQSFEIDPLLGLGERDRFEYFEKILGVALYPFGECENGASFLAIASDGRVFAL